MNFAGIKCAAFVTPAFGMSLRPLACHPGFWHVTPALVPGSPYTDPITEHIT